MNAESTLPESTLTAAQAAEIAKYEICYQAPNYRMSADRGRGARRGLAEVPWRGGYLDVGCGRGEMLDHAAALGFEPVAGAEMVEALLGRPGVQKAVAWDLPWGDAAFDVVSLFDVIEHLLPGDDEQACRELARVAKHCVLITANNLTSIHKGVELHVNRRPYEEWDGLFRAWFPGATVRWLKHLRAKNSEFWRIELPPFAPASAEASAAKKTSAG